MANKGSGLTAFMPKTALTLRCSDKKCRKPLKEVIRWIGADPYCRSCYRKKLGAKEEVVLKAAEPVEHHIPTSGVFADKRD